MSALKNAAHPLWEWLRGEGMSTYDLAARLHVARPMISYWCNGQRWVPLPIVRALERITRGRISLGDWPRVQDRTGKLFWRHGRKTAKPWPNARGRKKTQKGLALLPENFHPR